MVICDIYAKHYSVTCDVVDFFSLEKLLGSVYTCARSMGGPHSLRRDHELTHAHQRGKTFTFLSHKLHCGSFLNSHLSTVFCPGFKKAGCHLKRAQLAR